MDLKLTSNNPLRVSVHLQRKKKRMENELNFDAKSDIAKAHMFVVLDKT